MTKQRVFLIVLDSFGIGALPDASAFHDEGSDTLGACFRTGKLQVSNLQALGLFHIEGTPQASSPAPIASYGRMAEQSAGKDTSIGHWELAGVVSPEPLPTYPNGFPDEILIPFQQMTGRKVLCNKPYSGTQVIADYGEQHQKTGDLIVYTSADSVFQIAAHEDVVPVEQLYEYCRTARKLLCGRHSVGRVIARPFTGQYPNFVRTSNRHDFSLAPPSETMLDKLSSAGLDVIGVGKIYDIFAGRGITHFVRTTDNLDGMEKTLSFARESFHGLCFVNLVDFDMLYGHRNDALGYTLALNEFDQQLGKLLPLISREDLLIITADHGCDPSTPSTDHSREYVPLLVYSPTDPVNSLGTLSSFTEVSRIVLSALGL